MKLIIKFFSFLFLFSILYFLSPATISAQTNFTDVDIPKLNENRIQNGYIPTNNNPDVPLNTHTWTQTLLIESISAYSCQLTGIDPINPKQKCLGIDQNTGKIGFVENGGGAINVMGGLIANLYIPPIRTSDYTTYLADNFGIAKQTYAAPACFQGIGFCGLRPLMGIWTTMRNIVYLIFIILFIVVGLSIMLRIKIDPRTVMTIENQIPKMIIELLLVTFSFAIAGFLVDFMYVFTSLVFNIFNPHIVGKTFSINDVQGQNVFGFFNETIGFWDIAWNGSGVVGNMIGSMLGWMNNVIGSIALGAIGYILSHIAVIGIISKVVDVFNAIIIHPTVVGNGAGGVQLKPKAIVDLISVFAGISAGAALGFGSIGKVIAFLIIITAVFWALFRVLFNLLLAYVYILIDVALAPLIIATGVIPSGNPWGFGGWFRDLVANLAAFPLVIVLFLLGKVFIDQLGAAASSGVQPFVPPLIGNPGSIADVQLLIGLAILLLTPKAVQMTKDTFKSPEFKYAAGIGEAMGVGAGAMRLDKQAAGFGSTLFGLSHFGPTKNLARRFGFAT